MEVSWFSALCDDDYEYLGVPEDRLKSSLAHCGEITQTAEKGGFDNILLPSGYQLGMDSVAFAGAMAALTEKIKLLLAIRCGEMWPPQLARQIATLDQMLGGRLTINIISSDMPGQVMASPERYGRTLEVMQLLKALLDGNAVNHQGEHYQIELDPPRMGTVSGKCPPFYFGGLSPAARDVAAKAADVFLMWPDEEPNVTAILDDMKKRAADVGRTLRYGYRVHVIVRETEAEALDYTRTLMSKLDDAEGEAIRKKSLDAASEGVRRQAEMRDRADKDGFAEDQLWTGIGRARSGCGAAIVGDPDQVGIAAASCSTGVRLISGLVPGKGAVAAQAATSFLGRDVAMEMIADGDRADIIADKLADEDLYSSPIRIGLDWLQYGLVTLNPSPKAGSVTGQSVPDDWGSVHGDDYAISGNTLRTGVVDAVATAWQLDTVGSCKRPLSERLLRALEAGRDAGGDNRCPIDASSYAAFLFVAKPDDDPDTPSVMLEAPRHFSGFEMTWQIPLGFTPDPSLPEPVAHLREFYDAEMSDSSCGE
eukprot:s1_g1077.t1